MFNLDLPQDTKQNSYVNKGKNNTNKEEEKKKKKEKPKVAEKPKLVKNIVL